MTNENDLIRRGDADKVAKSLFRMQTTGLYGAIGVKEYGMLTEVASKAIAAIPAVAASQPADPVTNADSRQRVASYLARRKKSAQTVYEEIHSYDVGCDSEVVLFASDIEALIDVQPDPRDSQRRDLEKVIRSQRAELKRLQSVEKAHWAYVNRVIQERVNDHRDAQIAALVEALRITLEWMETARACGDAGKWEWCDGDEYTIARAVLAEIEKGEPK